MATLGGGFFPSTEVEMPDREMERKINMRTIMMEIGLEYLFHV